MYKMKTKLCNRCGEIKSYSEFYSNKAKPSGIQSDCIPCFKKNRKTIKPSLVVVPFPENIDNIEVNIPLVVDEVLTEYSISDYGRIRNKQGKLLKYSFDDRGYPQVIIYCAGKRISRRVHRLVASCFVPNLFLYPQVNHKDGNKLNMHYSNLEWCTSQDNVAHAWAMGLNKPNFKK